MKKTVLSVVLTLSFLSYGIFEFVDYKEIDNPTSLSTTFIQQLAQTFKADIFFETGTYGGKTTMNAIPHFSSIITVELGKELAEQAKIKLAPYNKVRVICSDSPAAIKQIAPTLKGTILFWLDAHCCGGQTALNGDPDCAEAITPIRGELKAIKEAHIKNCVILIDDIRIFGSTIDGQELLGAWAYPTLQEVRDALLEINPNFEFALVGDIFLAYDKFTYNPQFSDTVIACTKTRLYNGSNIPDAELLNLEAKIQYAPAHEKKFIRHLYFQMTERQDPMFWHDLWYGLVELGSGNQKNALDAFSKVHTRTRHLNLQQNRQLT